MTILYKEKKEQKVGTLAAEKREKVGMATQEGGGYAWIPSGMRSVDRQNLIKLPYILIMSWLGVRFFTPT